MTQPAGDVPAGLSAFEAIIAHACNRIVAYSGTHLLCASGLWTVYDGERAARAALNNLVRTAAIASGDDAPANLSYSRLRDLDIALLSAAQRGDISSVAGNAVDRHPVIPFNDGSHLHLDQGRDICRCDLAPLLLLNHGWNVPPPNWELLESPPAVLDRFPQDFFEAIARHLWGTSKDADFLASSTSSAGKSTVAKALELCLPGAIVVKQAHTTLTDNRLKFSAHVKPLVDARIVIYDEVGKVNPDKWTSILFEVSPPDLDIELKGADTVTRPRFGNAVFVGECPPAVDASVQGVDTRLGYTADLALSPIDAATRRHWLSDPEIARLRAWMLDFALSATQERRDAGYHLTTDRSVLVDGLVPEPVRYLRERFAGNGGDWLANKAITSALTDAGHEVPKGKGFSQFVKQCWPNAVDSRQADGRGWRGVGL